MLFADRAGVNLLARPNKMLCLLYTEEIEKNLFGVGCAFFVSDVSV